MKKLVKIDSTNFDNKIVTNGDYYRLYLGEFLPEIIETPVLAYVAPNDIDSDAPDPLEYAFKWQMFQQRMYDAALALDGISGDQVLGNSQLNKAIDQAFNQLAVEFNRKGLYLKWGCRNFVDKPFEIRGGMSRTQGVLNFLGDIANSSKPGPLQLAAPDEAVLKEGAFKPQSKARTAQNEQRSREAAQAKFDEGYKKGKEDALAGQGNQSKTVVKKSKSGMPIWAAIAAMLVIGAGAFVGGNKLPFSLGGAEPGTDPNNPGGHIGETREQIIKGLTHRELEDIKKKNNWVDERKDGGISSNLNWDEAAAEVCLGYFGQFRNPDTGDRDKKFDTIYLWKITGGLDVISGVDVENYKRPPQEYYIAHIRDTGPLTDHVIDADDHPEKYILK